MRKERGYKIGVAISQWRPEDVLVIEEPGKLTIKTPAYEKVIPLAEGVSIERQWRDEKTLHIDLIRRPTPQGRFRGWLNRILAT